MIATIVFIMETNRLIMLVESRIRGNVYVRFGGECLETYRSNAIRRRVLSLLKETVKIYEQHREYFDKLRGVSNLVKNARKVKECILLTGEISELYVTSYERMLSDRNFSADELSAIAAGYARLLERSAALLLELGDVVNVTEMSMTDKDRLDLIGNVYDELKDCRDLTAYYTRKNIAVSYSRSREAQDMERFMALYGNDADRYW